MYHRSGTDKTHACALDKPTHSFQLWIHIRNSTRSHLETTFFSKEMRFLVPMPTYQLWLSFHRAKMCLYFYNKPTITQTHRCHRDFSIPWGSFYTFIPGIKFTSKIHCNDIKLHYHKHWLCSLIEAQQYKTDCISDKLLLFYSASSC